MVQTTLHFIISGAIIIAIIALIVGSITDIRKAVSDDDIFDEKLRESWRK